MVFSSYNLSVRFNNLHDWDLSISDARDLQNRLAQDISRTGNVINPQYIAGIDVSVQRFKKAGTAAVVILNSDSMEVVEYEIAQGDIDFPYIPGLLSFRELPLILKACEKINHIPDLIMVDGQGIAHPRRLGLASHLGLFLDIPTIGCAKSRLVGTHKTPDIEPGSFEKLEDKEEIIGAVLRTKHNTKPLYISTGHKISLEDAVSWVMKCCRGYRLPEPTRFAHLTAGGNLKLRKESPIAEIKI